MPGVAEQFKSIAERARVVGEQESALESQPFADLEDAANSVGRSWSKSNLGYQANVYYLEFVAPPAGAFFSREWGFLGMFQGTKGDWHAYPREDVLSHLHQVAGQPDLTDVRTVSNQSRVAVQTLIHEAQSAAVRVPEPHDPYLTGAMEEIAKLKLPSELQLIRAVVGPMPHVISRDMQALEGGWVPAAHQEVLAQVAFIRSPFITARSLADVCERLARHLEALESAPPLRSLSVPSGGKVFVGHGGASKEYLELGVWLTNQHVEWEVFTHKPTAGLSTKERLLEILDDASMAFLLMTPEDETAVGELQARSNVIHEVGLFQGRLGFSKAIVLLEAGCAEFSNIAGLGQIRYPKNNVAAAFDEVRQVLVREGVL